MKPFGVNLSGGEFGEGHIPGQMNTDYIYPNDPNEYAYYAHKGQSLIRLPIKWERVQHFKWDSLSAPDIDAISGALDVAHANGQQVILELHNYGRYQGVALGKDDVDTLSDVWIKLAHRFVGHPALYGYELMNEPHDMPSADAWPILAQHAVNSIRNGWDRTHPILVPGDGWQSAWQWQANNANLALTDPANNLIYTAHLYFDADGSGRYNEAYPIGQAETLVNRVQPFLSWLSAHNARGMLTEYGVPNTDPRWLQLLDTFMTLLRDDDRIVGGTYWSGGPWWGSYPLSCEPPNAFTDAPQMAVLQKYGAQAPTPPPPDGAWGSATGTLSTGKGYQIRVEP